MIILIDAGHGKDTKGKQSPKLDATMNIGDEFTEDGRFKEYKYNRVIAGLIVDILKDMGYDARLVVTETNDVTLGERVRRINKVCKEHGARNVLMVSVHANAVGDSSSWMNGKGWEAYTTPGKTVSDELATFLYDRACKNLSGRKVRTDRTDGDDDKEANYYIIRESNCAAVLTENFFYDNKDDLEYMTSEEGVHRVVRTHVEGILDYIDAKKKK